MADRTLDWRDELGRWLKPFLARLGHKARLSCSFKAERALLGRRHHLEVVLSTGEDWVRRTEVLHGVRMMKSRDGTLQMR